MAMTAFERYAFNHHGMSPYDARAKAWSGVQQLMRESEGRSLTKDEQSPFDWLEEQIKELTEPDRRWSSRPPRRGHRSIEVRSVTIR